MISKTYSIYEPNDVESFVLSLAEEIQDSMADFYESRHCIEDLYEDAVDYMHDALACLDECSRMLKSFRRYFPADDDLPF